jgi:hypothetical protein
MRTLAARTAMARPATPLEVPAFVVATGAAVLAVPDGREEPVGVTWLAPEAAEASDEATEASELATAL